MAINDFARLRPSSPDAALRLAIRLVLLATAPMTTVAARVARGMFPLRGQEHLYRAAVASLTRTSRRAYLSSIAALATFDARADLARVRCPTLIVAGERDATVALEAKQEVARGIPGARLVVVPDSGHATHYDQPEIFNRMTLEFIRSRA